MLCGSASSPRPASAPSVLTDAARVDRAIGTGRIERTATLAVSKRT
jgi:hypothetical protein